MQGGALQSLLLLKRRVLRPIWRVVVPRAPLYEHRQHTARPVRIQDDSVGPNLPLAEGLEDAVSQYDEAVLGVGGNNQHCTGTTHPRLFADAAADLLAIGIEEAGDLPAAVARHPGLADWPLVVLVDDPEDAASSTERFLWTVFTRFEPAADLHGRDQRTDRFHVGLEPPVVLDARMKPWYPEVMVVDDTTRDLVDRRWGEYGLPG